MPDGLPDVIEEALRCFGGAYGGHGGRRHHSRGVSSVNGNEKMGGCDPAGKRSAPTGRGPGPHNRGHLLELYSQPGSGLPWRACYSIMSEIKNVQRK